MARYSKIVKKRKKRTLFLIPDHMQAFIARRIIDSAALFFLLGGACLIAALLSYNHADPSWNTSGGADASPHNWLGLPGAYIADALVQTIGLSGLIIGLTFAVWGFRIFRRQAISPFWARMAALTLTTLTAAIALAQIPADGILLQPYPGGSGGLLVLDSIGGLLPHVENSKTIAAIIAGTIALAAAPYTLAISRAEWLWLFSIIRQTAVNSFWLCHNAATGFYAWIRHYGDPSFLPKTKAPKIKKEKAPKPEKTRGEKRRVAPRLFSDEPVEAPAMAKNAPPPRPFSAIKVVTPPAAAPSVPASRQTRFSLEETSGTWDLPDIGLLQEPPPEAAAAQLDEDALHKNAELLQNVLSDFNVQGDIVSIHPGPVVTLYELEPAPGIKTSRVISLSDDIARSMAAVSVRCAVIPGRNVIGIELPNSVRQTVYLRDLMESRETQKTDAKLPLVLGKDIGGKPVVADLARMPHLLVAGTTGSGKSVAVNTMILSLLFRLPPDKCRFIMIDPKMLELSVYDDIPHLLTPVVTEPGKAVMSLKWAVQEMEDRYRAMSKLGVRNIEGYNARLREAAQKGETLMNRVQTGFDPDTGKPVYEEQPLDMTELPYIVIVIDEFADLMVVAGKDVENAVQRLAQMARAAGIHLVMATQRPSVDVITGVIKANFPTRISFQVTSKVDSRTILNEGGAEQLLGMGDMLFMAPGGRITRVHGPFVSDEEVERVVDHLKAQGAPAYIEDVTEGGSFGDSEVMAAMFGEGGGSGIDELYDQALALVAREGKASTSFIQRYLQIGYNRAARIIEEMERQGVVSKASPTGKRDVLVHDFSDA